LTDGYHLAEHKCPQHILVEEELAATHAFELMAALIRVLGIRCWIVRDAGSAHKKPPHCDLGSIPSQATVQDIEAILDARSTIDKRFEESGAASPTYDRFHTDSLILIGASTGGVDALLQILSGFSTRSPPTLIVQHTGGRFTDSLIRLLNGVTAAQVRAAIPDERPMPGHVYLAPNDETHLCLAGKSTPRITLPREGLLTGHRPSIDALFRSAKPFAPRVAAALLTGMGQDGARGLLTLRQAGAQTFGQDRSTSVVYGMPRVAMEMGGVGQQLPIGEIGTALLSACAAKVRA